MGKVIDLEQTRIENSPHLAGSAICLHCRHEWTAVAPCGTVVLDCPACGLGKGMFKNVCCPEEYWECPCGCSHFFVSGTGNTICAYCGKPQVFPE